MKKISIMACMLCILIMAPVVHASTIKLTTNSYSQTSGLANGGGEFTATPSADLSYLLTKYDSKAKIGSGFETFCLEHNEYFTPGNTYDASISNRAMNGGVVPAGTGDPISMGTAYLYSLFAQGKLTYGNTLNAANYDYLNTTADPDTRKSDAGKLQLAIWWLEQETYTDSHGVVHAFSYDASNEFEKLVYDKFGGTSGAEANANGKYGVSVLNLTYTTTAYDCSKHKWVTTVHLVQDQLVYNPPVSAPEPATMLLLGLGLVGVAGIRGKFKG